MEFRSRGDGEKMRSKELGTSSPLVRRKAPSSSDAGSSVVIPETNSRVWSNAFLVVF